MTAFEKKLLDRNRGYGVLPMRLAMFPELVSKYGFTRKEAVYFSAQLCRVRIRYFKEVFLKKERDRARTKCVGLRQKGFDPKTAETAMVTIPDYWRPKKKSPPQKVNEPMGAPPENVT